MYISQNIRLRFDALFYACNESSISANVAESTPASSPVSSPTI